MGRQKRDAPVRDGFDGEQPSVERRSGEPRDSKQHTARPLRRIVVLLLLAALLQLSPVGVRLEEQLGLPLLFSWRGPQPAPPGIALVTLDEASVIALQLPDLDQLEQWPRTLHAQLIRRLTAAGASVIAMDIAFLADGDPAANDELAAAMAASNVVILKLLHRASTSKTASDDTASDDNHRVTWQQEPLALLRRHATVTTFTLPDQAMQRQAALYIDTPEGREATLPVAALLRHLQHAPAQLPALLRDIGATALAERLTLLDSDTHFAAQLREALLDDAALARQLATAIDRHEGSERVDLQRLYDALRADSPAYINFYGPHHTIRTVSLQQLLQAPLISPSSTSSSTPALAALRGAIVFVGLSERIQKQRDYFFTAYASGDDSRISGVEVAATLAGNLLQQNMLQRVPAWQQLALLLIWGGALATAALRLRPLPWLAVLTLGCLFYALAAHWLFGAKALWLPIVVPLGLIAPALLLYSLWHHYRSSAAAELAARETLGLYVPADLAATVGQHRQALLHRRHHTDTFCLLTDIVGFTAFSELHDPDTVHRLMNRYYREVIAAVDNHGGSVANIVGDGLLALWPVDATAQGAERDAQCRQQAERTCAAARAIVAATDRLVATDAAVDTATDAAPLKTCVGLHFGSVSLGNLGAGSHYEYAPVGDTINTTSRVEACNRQFNTRILLTGAVRPWLDTVELRDLGHVALKGKRQPLQLFALSIEELSAIAERSITENPSITATTNPMIERPTPSGHG